MNNDLIKNRHSIRKFKLGNKLDKNQIDRLLEAAMLAPSACNSRPWEFIAVTKRSMLDKIADTHPYAQMCRTAAGVIIVVALPQVGRPEGYFPQDCAAATQNILLEAVSMGLGSCWCGVYPKEERMIAITQLLDIKAPKLPFNIIAIGVPDEYPETRGYFQKEKVTYID